MAATFGAIGVALLLPAVGWASYQVTANCLANSQPVSCDGWHVGALELYWTWTPADGNPSSGNCDTQTFYVDTATEVECDVSGPSGVGGTPQEIEVEISSPTATATLARPPDSNGWYNHPVTVAFSGSSFSGIASCTPTQTYAGPDSVGATVTGSCTDNAGKTVSASAVLQYDSTPPPLTASADPGDGSVMIQWTTPAQLSSLEISRSPGLNGAISSVIDQGGSGSYEDTHVKNGVHYHYTLTARSLAGNVSVFTLAATAGPRLLGPADGAHVTAPPLLRWTAVPHATYYNVQLYRRGKILSLWPSGARLQLGASWSFEGARYRLKPGTYRWYVWPGFGRRAAADYGRLVGTGSFVVSGRR